MNFKVSSIIISSLFCLILSAWLVSYKAIAQTQYGNNLKEPSQVADSKQPLLGVFYTDDYPKNISAINGAFWLYDFTTGKRDRVITFPRSDSGMNYKLKNNQILFETGGNLSLLKLADKSVRHISGDVPANQFVFSPDGNVAYYLTCWPFYFDCKSWNLHRYSIKTGKQETLKSNFEIDQLLGSDSLNNRIFFAKDNCIYAIKNGRISRIYQVDKRKASQVWYNFTLSPDGTIVLITQEARREGIVAGSIFDIAQKKYHVLDSKFIYLAFARFTEDSKSICGFFGNSLMCLDLQTLNFSERSFAVNNGFPVSWSPDQAALIVRREGFENRRGVVSLTLQPDNNQQYSYSIESEVADGNTPNFHFIGWFKR